jgi:hypothetical protein
MDDNLQHSCKLIISSETVNTYNNSQPCTELEQDKEIIDRIKVFNNEKINFEIIHFLTRFIIDFGVQFFEFSNPFFWF